MTFESPAKTAVSAVSLSGNLCMWSHEQGLHVWQKCMLRQETTFFLLFTGKEQTNVAAPMRRSIDWSKKYFPYIHFNTAAIGIQQNCAFSISSSQLAYRLQSLSSTRPHPVWHLDSSPQQALGHILSAQYCFHGSEKQIQGNNGNTKEMILLFLLHIRTFRVQKTLSPFLFCWWHFIKKETEQRWHKYEQFDHSDCTRKEKNVIQPLPCHQCW